MIEEGKGVFTLLSYLAFALSCVGHAAAETYYVAPADLGGSDENDGLRAARHEQGKGPWRTIQHAVNSVSPGDKILVRRGRYGEQIKIATSPIQIRAFPDERPLIDGEFKRGYGFWGAGEKALEDVLLEGFEIANQTQIGICLAHRDSRKVTIRAIFWANVAAHTSGTSPTSSVSIFASTATSTTDRPVGPGSSTTPTGRDQGGRV